MNTTSDEKQRLIDEAAAHGHTVTPKQIDRWRSDQVLPPAGKAGGGRGRGVQRPAPEGSAAQLIRLCEFLAEDRSLDRAAFRLWIEDYAIPLKRLRSALAHLSPNPKLVLGASGERLRDKAEEYAESIGRRKNAKPHVREMAKDGRLTEMLEAFLGMGLGRAVPLEQQQKVGEHFEKLSGLDRGRVDHWEGQSPWLTGDTTEQLALTASLLEAINPNLAETASEDELVKAKEGFKSLLILRRGAALLQQLHGPNVFGFGALTDLPIDVPMIFAEPAAYLGMIALNRKNPELLDQAVRLGKSLEGTLATLRAQVESRKTNLAT